MKNSHGDETDEFPMTKLDFHPKRDQERLEQREKELADFFENGAIGLHWVGPDGIILRANRCELETLGYAHEEYVGHHIAEFHVDQDVIEDILTRLTDGETLDNYPARLRCKDRSIKHVLINSNVYWENGVFKHTRCFTRDITTARIAEEELRSSEARFRALTETVTAGIFIWSKARYQFANPAMSSISGYSKAELLEMDFWDMAHPESQDVVKARGFARKRGEHVPNQYETRIICKDGSTRWIELVATKSELDGEPAIIGTAYDITERKLALESLTESELRFRQLADHMLDVFWMYDAKIGGLLYVSPAYAAIWGRSCSSLYNTPTARLDAVHENERRRVTNSFTKLCNDSEFVFDEEYRIVQRDGTVKWIHDRGFPICDQQGHVYRVAGIAEDVTKRKRDEERLLQTERLAAIGQMVTGLAHESRNALQRSQACLEMLRDEVAEQSAALKLIDRTQIAQDHLHHLYEEVRRYAAPVKLQRTECDLRDIWRESWSNLVDTSQGNGVNLREEMNGMGVICRVDRHSIDQVFRNVLENAIVASPEDADVVLHCSETVLHDQQAVRIAISDKGPGLLAEQLKNIFEPFYTTKTRGTGLGMSIAKRIIEAHGGGIRAENSEDSGAEIVIILPRN